MRKLAIDCEMVGIGNKNVLARVAVVDEDLNMIYDTYVAPPSPYTTMHVTDFRTAMTGITAGDLRNAPSFSQVQQKVKNLISGCLLIGHSVADVDLKVLELAFPEHNIRDVALYPPFRKYNNGQKPALKDLAEKILGERIQTGYHNPVEDARACMKLYKHVERDWK